MSHDPMNETEGQKAKHQTRECLTTLPKLKISPKAGKISKGSNAPGTLQPRGCGVCTEEHRTWGAGKRTVSSHNGQTQRGLKQPHSAQETRHNLSELWQVSRIILELESTITPALVDSTAERLKAPRGLCPVTQPV